MEGQINKSAGNVEIGIRALADSLGEGLLVIQQDRVVFMNERLAGILGTTREELAEKDLNQMSLQDSVLKEYLQVRGRRERGEDSFVTQEVRISLDNSRTVFMRNRSSRIEWEGKVATVHFLEDITDGRHDGFPELRVEWQVLESDA